MGDAVGYEEHDQGNNEDDHRKGTGRAIQAQVADQIENERHQYFGGTGGATSGHEVDEIEQVEGQGKAVNGCWDHGRPEQRHGDIPKLSPTGGAVDVGGFV